MAALMGRQKILPALVFRGWRTQGSPRESPRPWTFLSMPFLQCRRRRLWIVGFPLTMRMDIDTAAVGSAVMTLA